MNRLGPIRIEYWCDGCSQIKHYQRGAIGCRETEESLYALSKTHYSDIRETPNCIPTPKSCPYLIKKQRKDKLNELHQSTL